MRETANKKMSSMMLAVIALSALCLGNCVSQPSREITNLVIDGVNSYWTNLGFQVSNVKIRQTLHPDLTVADRANNIEDFWCVELTLTVNRYGTWYDEIGYWVAVKTGGQWDVVNYESASYFWRKCEFE